MTRDPATAPDGIVNLVDFLQVLAFRGPCP
jgi:hypothetical protein